MIHSPLNVVPKLLLLLIFFNNAIAAAQSCSDEFEYRSSDRLVNEILEDELKIGRASERLLTGLLASHEDPNHMELRDFVARVAHGLSQETQQDHSPSLSNFDQLVNSRVLAGLVTRDLINSVSIHYALPITWTFNIYMEAKPIEGFDVLTLTRVDRGQFEVETLSNNERVVDERRVSGTELINYLVPTLNWQRLKVTFSTTERRTWLCQQAKLPDPFVESTVTSISFRFR